MSCPLNLLRSAHASVILRDIKWWSLRFHPHTSSACGRSWTMLLAALGVLLAGTAAHALEPVRGVVKPKKEITLSSEFSAKLLRVPFDEGERFKKGDLLVQFDCAHFKAQTNAAWAAHRASKEAHAANRELDQFAAIGKSELLQSEAQSARTAAEARALEARTKHCTIGAPFHGIVVERNAHPHEVPGSNQQLLRIMNDSVLELDMIVPSSWLRWLRKGARFSFAVDETASSYDAEVTRIGASVDAVSQTIKIKGTFLHRPSEVLPGMSGSAQFSPPAS